MPRDRFVAVAPHPTMPLKDMAEHYRGMAFDEGDHFVVRIYVDGPMSFPEALLSSMEDPADLPPYGPVPPERLN